MARGQSQRPPLPRGGRSTARAVRSPAPGGEDLPTAAPGSGGLPTASAAFGASAVAPAAPALRRRRRQGGPRPAEAREARATIPRFRDLSYVRGDLRGIALTTAASVAVVLVFWAIIRL